MKRLIQVCSLLIALLALSIPSEARAQSADASTVAWRAEVDSWRRDYRLGTDFDEELRRYIDASEAIQLPEAELREGARSFRDRYVAWRDSLLVMMGVCFVFWVCSLIPALYQMSEEGNLARERKQYRTEPWLCSTAYLRWLVGGLWGLHLLYLRRYRAYAFWTTVFWGGLMAGSQFVFLYLPEPRLWGALRPQAFGYWQSYVLGSSLLMWIVSAVCIPYWVYLINFRVFRRNIYEKLILEGDAKGYEELLQLIPRTVKRDLSRIKDITESAQATYAKEQGSVSKFFSFITNSKVGHAKSKAEELYDYARELGEIATEHGAMLRQLTGYLEVERKNAYRNLVLTQEMIRLLAPIIFKHSHKKDEFAEVQIDAPRSVALSEGALSQVDLGKVFDQGVKDFGNTFTSIMNTGAFKGKESLGIALGFATISNAVDGVIQINARRTQERLHYEQQASKLIQDIVASNAALVESHAKMLRANELMKSLAKSNEAFVQLYVPLRDAIFGTEPTLRGFFDHLLGREKNRVESYASYLEDMLDMMKTYNDFNKQEITDIKLG